MSTSCVLHPRLSNGEKSPLFFRLKEFFLGDRKLAENVYYKAINPAFRKAFPNVRFDHNGEPLLEDLITQCGIGYNKDSESMLDFLNSEYGTKSVPKTIQSVIELQNRAASFNINNPLNRRYSAQLTSSGQDISMGIVEATGNERDLGRQQKFNAELNNQLIKLLNGWGADVAALTELEEASNINGVMDLSAGINAATGLKEVIRISKRHRWSNISEKQNILSDEEQEILNNASRDSQGRLLAPNGKVSNLTEKQYAQVRTKAFKEWFGDWINDSANASKVVDENGEPLVVYHGSKSIFHTFRNKYETYKEEKYLETSEIKKEALDTFTDKEKNTLIPLINKFEDNPFIALSEFTKSEEELFNKYSKQLNILENSRKKVIQHYNIGDFFTTDKTYAETYGTNVYSVFLNIRNPKYSDKLHRIYTSDSRINSLQEEGYDSVIGNDVKGRDVESKGKEYLVFNPNQIKSATDNTGAFSTKDDNINNNQIDFFEDNTDVRKKPQIKDDIEKGKDYTIDKLIELFNKYSIDKEQQELAKKVFAVAKKLNFKV